MELVPFRGRREEREPIEMMARFRRGISTITVMLKDLTPHGARIEGVGHLEPDDAVVLILPNMKPTISFVAWSNDHCAGLEFADPLDFDIFRSLVKSFGRCNEGSAIAA